MRFPPGKIAVRLGPEHWSAYRRLYAAYGSVLSGLPVLRDRDFHGGSVKMTQAQLDALNDAFERLATSAEHPRNGSAFAGQERGRTSLFKRLQHLS